MLHSMRRRLEQMAAREAAGELERLKHKHPAIVEVRGAGLMWGIELNVDATPVVDAAIRRGLLINRTAQKVVRLLPPLVIAEADLDRGLALLDAVLGEVLSGVAA